MSTNKYYLLSYNHDEIQDMLNRVHVGKLLTEKDYDHLINKIGIKNISVFDGYYNSLQGKPDLDYLIASAITENNLAIMKDLISEMEAKDKKVVELLENHVVQYEKLINDLQSGLIKLDEDSKTYINSSVAEISKVLDERVADLQKQIDKKSDKDHIHLIEEIYDLYEILELKSNVSHTHDTDHVHTNKDLLDSLNEFHFKKWDAKVDIEEIPTKLSQLVNDIDLVNEEFVDEHIQNALPDFDKFALVDDVDYLLDGKANLNHLHNMQHIEGLNYSLSMKVDKEKNKVLIDKNLLKRIEEWIRKKEQIVESGEVHGHENLDALDCITRERIELWNHKVDESKLNEILANYTTSEIITNYYKKDETYNRQEIINKIEEYGFGTAEELNRRLGGLTFIPVTLEEYNALPETDKAIETNVYIITDDPNGDEESLKRFIRDQFNLILMEEDGVITNDELNTRLDGLSFKKIRTADYNKLTDEEKKQEDILYVITDSYEYDVSEFVTEDTVKDLILNAQLEGADVDLSSYAKKAELDKKVDKEYGKSLIDTNEIDRLATLKNANYQFEIFMVEDEEPSVIIEGEYPDLIFKLNIPKAKDDSINTEVFNQELDKRLNGLTIHAVTEAEYEALPEDKRDSKTDLYFVTDPSDEGIDIEQMVTKEELNDRLNNLSMPTKSDRPASPVIGQCFFDMNLKLPIWFNGDHWIDGTGKEV